MNCVLRILSARSAACARARLSVCAFALASAFALAKSTVKL